MRVIVVAASQLARVASHKCAMTHDERGSRCTVQMTFQSGTLLTYCAQNSRKSARSGKLARRKRMPSAKLTMNVSVRRWRLRDRTAALTKGRMARQLLPTPEDVPCSCLLSATSRSILRRLPGSRRCPSMVLITCTRATSRIHRTASQAKTCTVIVSFQLAEQPRDGRSWTN